MGASARTATPKRAGRLAEVATAADDFFRRRGPSEIVVDLRRAANTVNAYPAGAQEIADAIGRYTGNWYVNGTGSGQPQGVASAISGSGTVSTGGWTTDPTVESMIDLEFSVVHSYGQRPSAAWMVADSAAKVLRADSFFRRRRIVPKSWLGEVLQPVRRFVL